MFLFDVSSFIFRLLNCKKNGLFRLIFYFIFQNTAFQLFFLLTSLAQLKSRTNIKMNINNPTYKLGILELCFLQKIVNEIIKVKKPKLTLKISHLKEMIHSKNINRDLFSNLARSADKKWRKRYKQYLKSHPDGNSKHLMKLRHDTYREELKNNLKDHLLPYKNVYLLLLFLEKELKITVEFNHIPYKRLGGRDFLSKQNFDKWVDYTLSDDAKQLFRKNPPLFLFMFDTGSPYDVAGYLLEQSNESLRTSARKPVDQGDEFLRYSAGGYAYPVIKLKNVNKDFISDFLKDYFKNNLCYKSGKIFFARGFIDFPNDNFERFVVYELFQNRSNGNNFLLFYEVIGAYNDYLEKKGKKDSGKRDRAVKDCAVSINKKFKAEFKYVNDLIEIKRNKLRINENIINPAY